MRIARFEFDQQVHTGVVVGDRVVSVAALGLEADVPVIDVLQMDKTARATLQADAEASAAGVSLKDVRLLAPIPNPPKYIAVGMNSPSHSEELADAEDTPLLVAARTMWGHLAAAYPDPQFPLMFNKQASCVTGPFDPIWHPADSEQVDFEGEVALVIGRRARRLNEAQAAEAIVGYMVTNDVSVREWQNDTSQMWLGKSFETHGPTGPWVITSDEVDPSEMVIRTWVNGELRQNGRLADQLQSPTQIVSHISQVCTLEAGDIVATGTPAGVGAIDGRFLSVGDRVRIAVEGIGEIENVVVAEPARSSNGA